jgi:hypothetical protein
MIGKSLLSLAILVLGGAGVQAQSAEYGAIENFYEANPDLIGAQYAGRFVNPNYILINWDQREQMDSRMTSNGFVRLGVSSWVDHDYYGGGIPQRDLAIAYARVIGAEVVVYAAQDQSEENNRYFYSIAHSVYFYTRPGGSRVQRTTPGSQSAVIWSELSNAEAQLQAAWDRLPAHRKNQLRPSQRAWIIEKDAASPERRLRMVNERTAWLLQQG